MDNFVADVGALDAAEDWNDTEFWNGLVVGADELDDDDSAYGFFAEGGDELGARDAIIMLGGMGWDEDEIDGAFDGGDKLEEDDGLSAAIDSEDSDSESDALEAAIDSDVEDESPDGALAAAIDSDIDEETDGGALAAAIDGDIDEETEGGALAAAIDSDGGGMTRLCMVEDSIIGRRNVKEKWHKEKPQKK